MNTRIISFAGQCVAVEYEGSRSQEIVDYLFEDINEEAQKPPDLTFSIQSKPGSGELSLHRDKEEIYVGDSNGEMASMLMDQVLFHLIKGNRDGVLIHCAVMARDNFGILLPGTTGAGKSTFTAWLASKGFTYLTDEMAFVETGSRTIQSFTRPFNIKTLALRAVRDELGVDVDSDQLISNDRATLIPHRQIKPDYQYCTPELGLILYPRFRPLSEFKLTELSPALSGLDLMKCLINARNLEGDGFPEIARLVRETPSYSMSYGGFEQLGDELFEILNTKSDII